MLVKLEFRDRFARFMIQKGILQEMSEPSDELSVHDFMWKQFDGTVALLKIPPR